jgi:hypothetical protein
MAKDTYNALRRRTAIAEGRCINGKLHALPEIDPRTGKRRIRCEWCDRVHAMGVVKALELATDPAEPQPPPGARYAYRRAS